MSIQKQLSFAKLVAIFSLIIAAWAAYTSQQAKNTAEASLDRSNENILIRVYHRDNNMPLQIGPGNGLSRFSINMLWFVDLSNTSSSPNSLIDYRIMYIMPDGQSMWDGNMIISAYGADKQSLQFR